MMQRQPRSDATPAMLLGMVEAFSSFGTWCSPSASFGILDMHVDAIVNKNSCLTDRDGLSNTSSLTKDLRNPRIMNLKSCI